jgi:hypothetical protein
MKKILKEDKLNSVVRQIVRDVISVFKKHNEGEFGLPEDLYPDQHYYEFEQIETPLQIFVDLSQNTNVEGFDVDAEFYRDEDLIYITIVYNPNFGTSYIQDLVSELNEIIRHELEHVKQFESGVRFPKEPKSPEKYYSQKHELEAQRAGFKRRSKGERIDYETLVRRWFEDNKHKHKMNPEQAERVIQKILNQK